MKTIELRLSEVLALQSELIGFTNPQTGETVIKGFINHSFSLKEKYWLNKLVTLLTTESQEIEKLRNTLIEKYGEKDELGNISIPTLIENEANPKFLQFQKEYQDLLDETKTISYKPIKLGTLNSIITEDTYNLLFRLVEEDDHLNDVNLDLVE